MRWTYINKGAMLSHLYKNIFNFYHILAAFSAPSVLHSCRECKKFINYECILTIYLQVIPLLRNFALCNFA